MRELGKKLKMPMFFGTETDQGANQNILTESHDLPYKTSFNKAVLSPKEESRMGSYDQDYKPPLFMYVCVFT